MLTRCGAALAFVALSFGEAARADEDPADRLIREPDRLTVSVADDLLGQLSLDRKTVYFVSNRNTTDQVFAQNIEDGRAKLLFDDDADVTWPRISPDGTQLLYVSYRDQAAGRLCVRGLPDGGGRRCLDDQVVALQAEWIDDRRIALVSRTTIQGETSVLEVSVGSHLRSNPTPLLNRSVTSPTVSPDGRWLVYVPVTRKSAAVGPAFAAHAAQELAIARLGGAAPPVSIAVDLPGQTGQPVFARDGRSLYFVQFFVDTNHDDAVDAADHGVIFRVPISFAGDTPTLGHPEQLTLTSSNCEYPAPFADRLVITCSENDSLDLFALPLDGQVPAAWTTEDLGASLAAATGPAETQMLASRLLARETSASGRDESLLRLALVHLEAEEFRAAEFYAKRLGETDAPERRALVRPFLALVEQRRASRRRDQGRMMDGFAAAARKRLDELQGPVSGPLATMLTRMARSEIAGSIGDWSLARSELGAVAVDEAPPPALAQAYYLAADTLYRQLDDRDSLVAVCRALAANRGLTADEQLRYADAGLRALTRGLSTDRAQLEIAESRLAVRPDEGELSFARSVAAAVLDVRDSHPPAAAVERILTLYRSATRSGRRRVVVRDAVQRATDLGAESLLEAVASLDVHDVKRGTRERHDAERLFRRVFTGRAYARAAARQYADAAADFDAVARETGSLEAIVGSIDMRLKGGEPAEAVAARFAAPSVRLAVTHFAQAYVLARQLPKLSGEVHARGAQQALSTLQASWSELKDQRIAQALFGALLHEQYLMTNDLGTAERANVHYLIALELMGKNPRFRAMILGQLGILHADVGNFRIALGYLLERDALPYSDNSEGLDAMLSEAQSLLHVGRDADAAALADRALALLERTPTLARYRLLALDEAALYHLAAGHAARALALYDEEIPLALSSEQAGAKRNEVVLRLARAAAKIGAAKPAEALKDLDDVAARLPSARQVLQWPHATATQVERAYGLLVAGLRARAYRALGQLDAEAAALEARLAILDAEQAETPRPEVAASVVVLLAELAMSAGDRHDAPAAARWLTRALASQEEQTPRDPHRTAVLLRLASELTVRLHTTLVPGLAQRLDAVLAEPRPLGDRSDQAWLEIAATLANDGHTVAAPAPASDPRLPDEGRRP